MNERSSESIASSVFTRLSERYSPHHPHPALRIVRITVGQNLISPREFVLCSSTTLINASITLLDDSRMFIGESGDDMRLLQMIAASPQLRTLALRGTWSTSTLATISGMHALQDLSLSYRLSAQDDSIIRLFAELPNLRALSFGLEPDATTTNPRFISGFHSLRSLALVSNNILAPNAIMKRIHVETMDTFKITNYLEGTAGATLEEFMHTVAEACPQLKEIDLTVMELDPAPNTNAVTEKAQNVLEPLFSLTGLTKCSFMIMHSESCLDMYSPVLNFTVEDDDVRVISSRWPKLEQLALPDTNGPGIGLSAFASLVHSFPLLTELQIDLDALSPIPLSFPSTNHPLKTLRLGPSSKVGNKDAADYLVNALPHLQEVWMGLLWFRMVQGGMEEKPEWEEAIKVMRERKGQRV